jgi:cytochrome c-type biogenesis protein CcmE
MQGNQFDCKDILLKCPSKYKDEVSANEMADKKI